MILYMQQCECDIRHRPAFNILTSGCTRDVVCPEFVWALLQMSIYRNDVGPASPILKMLCSYMKMMLPAVIH